jgi:hypothetical protein
MAKRSTSAEAPMLDQLAGALTKADGATFDADPARYRRLAHAALKVLARPTEDMIDAAYEAVRFDEHWAVNSRRDFRKGVRAMMLAAAADGTVARW